MCANYPIISDIPVHEFHSLTVCQNLLLPYKSFLNEYGRSIVFPRFNLR